MLTQFQQQVLSFITQQTLSAGTKFAAGEDVVAEIDVTAGYAFALYRDLMIDERRVEFSESLRENREVKLSDPAFFRHLHALQEFVAGVNALNR